jgi:hypothetical protein
MINVDSCAPHAESNATEAIASNANNPFFMFSLSISLLIFLIDLRMILTEVRGYLIAPDVIP